MLWNILIFIAVIMGLFAALFYPYVNKTIAKNSLALAVLLLLVALAKQYMIPFYYVVMFESTIRSENPIVDVIAKNCPFEFQAYLAKVKKSIYENGDQSRVAYFTNQLISRAVQQYLPVASNASVYEFSKIELAFDEKLLKLDPKLVLYVELGNQYSSMNDDGAILNVFNDPAMLTDVVNAQKKLIESAIAHPEPPLTEPQRLTAAAMMADIHANLVKTYGADTLKRVEQNPNDPALDKRKAAEVIMSLYRQIIATGPENAGIIWKYLFSGPNTAKPPK
jgi:hypothetical protein